ncbi:glycosyltransferase [Comamonadaceae bacterium OTU4NAUVB1]|nr:glycosyltransferase [Comamonadaceae bacterium OTU4NAUVB1]
MKILHVIPSMDPAQGGVAQAVRNMVPALAQIDVHNEVLSFDAADAGFLGRDGFPVHAIGPAKGGYGYCAALGPWLAANLQRFDVVIAHGLWQHHCAGTWRAVVKHRRAHAASAGSPRFYVMPHGMLDPYFQKAPGRRLKALRNTVFWKFIEAKPVNGADGVLFTCAEELTLAREPFTPYRPRRELEVGLGIEAPPPRRPAMAPAFAERCPQVAGRPYLLFLSRLHEKKGTDLLIRAYVELQARWHRDGKGPALPALVVAGPGLDTEYGRSLQQLAAPQPGGPGPAPDVHFPGMLSGDAKWGALYGCEAFVLPSHQENFGIAVVEAMACGRPVLISRQVNIWRECEPGGIVADDTQAGTLELLTRWLALTPQQQAMLGDEAHAAYQRHFEVDQAARRLKEALQPGTSPVSVRLPTASTVP